MVQGSWFMVNGSMFKNNAKNKNVIKIKKTRYERRNRK